MSIACLQYQYYMDLVYKTFSAGSLKIDVSLNARYNGISYGDWARVLGT